MVSCWHRGRTIRSVALLCTASVIGSLISARVVQAGERQFLVILANSPKQFPGAGAPVNPELIRKQYFDKLDPNIGSFAEYWEEISYGDVRISEHSHVTDWINLPWPVAPTVPVGHIDLNEGQLTDVYRYGTGEDFSTDRPMVDVNIGNYPSYAHGGNDRVPGTNTPVWMPGERFIDMDEDGLWDGHDEATNQMDWDGDGAPDLLGPWIDLNGNGVPENPVGCRYLEDGDNDGNPDCCPDGPTDPEAFPPLPGCRGFPDDGNSACPGTFWTGPRGVRINDCNGNLIPDACDVRCDSAACAATGWLDDQANFGKCGGSEDRLPMSPGDNLCDTETPNGIPDECEYVSADEPCTLTDPGNDPMDPQPCDNTPQCAALVPSRLPNDLRARCEYDDANGNGVLDIVEPFENRLLVSSEYVDRNYPGDKQALKDRSEERELAGSHDPFRKLTGVVSCMCPNGEACVGSSRMCRAGYHAQFDPPDYWVEEGNTKMQPAGYGDLQTPEPSWYRQAWIDRYGTTPPDWSEGSLATSFDDTRRRAFAASHGGTSGHGSGWVGCSDGFDPVVAFATPPAVRSFQTLCNHRILPEEMRGIGQPLTLYDGPVEHDDLPSSKYHRQGDQRLGEVTSPYNTSIFGQDRGDHDPGSRDSTPDDEIPAAGPYARHIHGNFGRDAGNVLHMEMLTWRTDGAHASLGGAWTDLHTTSAHPFTRTLGFRDYNCDGLVDQGEVRFPGTDNYLVEPSRFRSGVRTEYPWNRTRLVEDCIEILDDVLDFDDFVDRGTMEHVTCGGSIGFTVPDPYRGSGPTESEVTASGVLSGIVMLPPGAHTPNDFVGSGLYVPIHNEDGLNDPQYANANRPLTQDVGDPVLPGHRPQISWNLFFNNLVQSIGVDGEGGAVGGGNFLTGFVAHEYAHTWEGFVDLYDYDMQDAPLFENCPIGAWDIMADGGLVHPIPPLKAKDCTNWIVPVDLRTVLTPGVDKLLTLPPAELVRDNSYYFLPNERPREEGRDEHLYLWSAGRGFDRRMPGEGMLMLHMDAASNFEAVPQQQRSADRPAFRIVQADGNKDLEACLITDNRGDDGDPWPGSTGATVFNLNTNPSSTWYAQSSWTGLDISDIVPDGNGSVQVVLNWVPTTIPSLRFRQPPGGVSVGSTYQVRFDATDVYGGTTVRLYFMKDRKTCSGSGAACTDNTECQSNERCRYDTRIGTGAARLVGQLKKTTPGTNALSIPWNIQGVTDGRYVLFAKLNPGPGADGSEKKNTDPQAGRNNVGTGYMRIDNVAINNNTFDDDDYARLETWVVTCIDNGQTWRVNSTLTQPVLDEDDPDADPYAKATTNLPYVSAGQEVAFTIVLRPGSVPFQAGDTFSFTTTGITAASRPVTIAAGRISEDPIAIIHASPLSGRPPLTVEFDGRDSVDPSSANLNFFWDFGDGDVGAGATSQHVFDRPGTYTVVLKVVNPNNQRFGEAAVDILVTNNSPKAVVSALPTSGMAPLQVAFNASASSDAETAPGQLIYVWDYGDGNTANNQLNPGMDFQSVTHTYRKAADGSACTHASPCEFLATLTVIDELGAEGTASVQIVVGNSKPNASVTVRPVRGPAPLQVEFNAINSTDPDDDTLTVNWHFGDGDTELNLPTTGQDGVTGRVLHTYLTQGEYTPTAVFKDGHGGVTTWPAAVGTVVITVTGNEVPSAAFAVTPAVGEAGQPMEFDASGSVDVDGVIEAYTWDFGDGDTQTAIIPEITHTYENANLAGYLVKLTVRDNIGAESSVSRTIVVGPARGNLPPIAHIATGPRSGVVPLSLTLDGRTSFDPDNDPLVYSWSLRHDGTSLVITTDGQRNWNAAEENPPGGALYRCSLTEGDARICAALWADSPPESIAEGAEDVSFARSATANGATLPMVFRTPGVYLISMTVDDGRENGAVTTEPKTIIVTEPGEAPPDDGDDEPGQDVPDDDEPPDSADQRPGVGMCGIGMLMSLFGSLLGLTAIRATRRRQHP